LTYITYPQTEELLKCYPKLKSYLKNLQLELERLFREGKNDDIDPDEIMYSLSIGNRVVNDMPHAMPTPGDKMTNIVITKDRIIEEEMRNRMTDINTIGEVVEKISNTLECLTTQEKQIIEFKYFESMVWKDILKTTKAFVEERQAKQQRRVAIEKMLPLLRITTEQFEFCIRKVKTDVID